LFNTDPTVAEKQFTLTRYYFPSPDLMEDTHTQV